jgi:uncharacterized protein YcbX
VKSFRGERVTSLRFRPGGPEHDRRFMLVDESELRHGQRLTAREVRELLGNAATVQDGVVLVRTASGSTLRSDDAGFESALRTAVGRPVSLHEDTSGDNHDDSDVLVINMASARALSAEYGAPRSERRFRPNIILDGSDAPAYSELEWIGRRFHVGDVELEVTAPDLRCAIPTIDPDTLEVDPAFLRYIVEHHEGKFGIYCKVIKSGTVREGDDWRAAAG